MMCNLLSIQMGETKGQSRNNTPGGAGYSPSVFPSDTTPGMTAEKMRGL